MTPAQKATRILDLKKDIAAKESVRGRLRRLGERWREAYESDGPDAAEAILRSGLPRGAPVTTDGEESKNPALDHSLGRLTYKAFDAQQISDLKNGIRHLRINDELDIQIRAKRAALLDLG